MDTARRSRNDFGVRELVRAFGRRLVAVECGKTSNSPGPLDAALLWRQAAKAAKTVTSHRTPNVACGSAAPGVLQCPRCSLDPQAVVTLARSARILDQHRPGRRGNRQLCERQP